MYKRLFVVVCLTITSVAFVSGQAPRVPREQRPATPAAAASPAPDVSAQRALLDQYCVTCHNQKLKTANLLLDQLDLAHLGDRADVGEKVIRKLRAGMMPPSGMPRPDPVTREKLISWMENELDQQRQDPSAAAWSPPAQSHRVRERDSRFARRAGRHEQVPPVRRLDPRVRQHGGDADDVAGAHRGVSVGGRQDQPPRHRRCVESVADRVRRAHGHFPERTYRGYPVRYARRHGHQAPVPGRRRICDQGEGHHRLLQQPARTDQGRAARGHDRRRAREAVRLGQGDRYGRSREGRGDTPRVR